MPNTKSAKKSMKTSEEQRLRNKAVKTRVSSMRRKLFETIDQGSKAACEPVFRSYCSVMDKAVKQGSMAKNAADRRKSRAALRMAALVS